MFSNSRESADSIKNYPINDETITSLRNQFSTESDPDSRSMMKLLIAVQDFRDSTAPASQSKRDSYIAPKVSIQILNKIADSLQQFQANMKDDPQKKDIYNYCIKVVAERIDEMRKSKDKIYLHYTSFNNNLTAALPANVHAKPANK